LDLTNLIEIHLDVPRLAKDLDDLGHAGRTWSVRRWNRGHMAVLYEAVKGFRPISLDHFVPPGTPPLVEVVHDGENSLPTFRHFQKRFCLPAPATTTEPAVNGDGGGARLLGYNHQPFEAFTGPGYFLVRPSAEAGEVDIDYTMIAPQSSPKPPAAWPKVTSIRHGLGRFVYDGTVDVMRGLSSHVSMGRAMKKKAGRWLDTWFVLVREDPAPNAGG